MPLLKKRALPDGPPAPRSALPFSAGHQTVLEGIAAGAPLRETLDRVVRMVEEQAPGARGSILLLEEAGEMLRHGAAPSLPATYVEAIDGVRIGPDAGSCGTAAYLGRQVVCADVAADPRWIDYRAIALRHGLRACWSSPIRSVDGGVLGTFAIYYSQPRRPSQREVELIGGLTHMAGIAIERARSEQRLRESEAEYRTLVERLPAVLYVSVPGEHGAWQYVSPQIEEILGFTPEEWTAQPGLWASRLHPDDRARALSDEQAVVDGATEIEPVDYRMIAKDGRVVWIRDDAVLDHDAQGNRVWRGFLYDVSDQKRIETVLERHVAQQAAIARLGEHALEGATLTDLMSEAVSLAAGVLDVDHAAVLELLADDDRLVVRAGFGWPDTSIGRADPTPSRDTQAGFALATREPVIVDDWSSEARFRKPEVLEQLGTGSGMAIVIEGAEGPFGVFEVHSREGRCFTRDDAYFVRALANVLADAIERQAAESHIRHQALHDPLTGLPNRTLFADRLDHALARSRRRRSPVAVLFLDLDNFKLINDGFGHEAGDELLSAIAPRLTQVVRPSDTVARFGGDEFAVLLEDTRGERDAIAVAERIAGAFARPFAVGGIEQFVSASVGIALADNDRVKPEVLIRDADAAMYRAKERGRARYELFDEVMRARVVERLQIENDLRGAVERDELILEYQPLVSLRDGAILGFESLIRWEHPRRGHLPPDEFIHIAEEGGLIEPIGSWVLEEACRHAAGWQDLRPDGPPVGISVNLSARQVSQRDLPALVSRVLRATGLEPGCLTLEITESALVEEGESAGTTLRALKALGVRLAIDDFGTGYSALGYLQRFPVDVLKIDRSFVAGLGHSEAPAAIVAAILGIGRALSLPVVAEGVETEAQVEALRRLGCERGQGFWFASAVSTADARALLESVAPWADRMTSCIG